MVPFLAQISEDGGSSKREDQYQEFMGPCKIMVRGDSRLSNVTMSRLNSYKLNDGQTEFSSEQILLPIHDPNSV